MTTDMIESSTAAGPEESSASAAATMDEDEDHVATAAAAPSEPPSSHSNVDVYTSSSVARSHDPVSVVSAFPTEPESESEALPLLPVSITDSDTLARLEELANASFPLNQELHPSLVDIITISAQSGRLPVSWRLMKPLVLAQFDAVVRRMNESNSPCETIDGEPFQDRVKAIHNGIANFESEPWTLQRMAELLLNPNGIYRNAETFVVAFSKLVNGICPYSKRVHLAETSTNRLSCSFSGEAETLIPSHGVGPLVNHMQEQASRLSPAQHSSMAQQQSSFDSPMDIERGDNDNHEDESDPAIHTLSTDIDIVDREMVSASSEGSVAIDTPVLTPPAPSTDEASQSAMDTT